MTTYIIANASDAHEAAEATGMGVEQDSGWDVYWGADGYLDTARLEHDEDVHDQEAQDIADDMLREATWAEMYA